MRRDRRGGGQTAGGARPRERGPRAQACRTAEDCRARPPGCGRSPGSCAGARRAALAAVPRVSTRANSQAHTRPQLRRGKTSREGPPLHAPGNGAASRGPVPPRQRPCLACRSREGRRTSPAREPALRPTRLETRTKESCRRASHWASTNPTGEMKVNQACRAALQRRDPAARSWAHRRPVPPASARRPVWRSQSASARTRKMVNYA